MTVGSSYLSRHLADPVQLNLSRRLRHRRRYQCTKLTPKRGQITTQGITLHMLILLFIHVNGMRKSVRPVFKALWVVTFDDLDIASLWIARFDGLPSHSPVPLLRRRSCAISPC